MQSGTSLMNFQKEYNFCCCSFNSVLFKMIMNPSLFRVNFLNITKIIKKTVRHAKSNNNNNFDCIFVTWIKFLGVFIYLFTCLFTLFVCLVAIFSLIVHQPALHYNRPATSRGEWRRNTLPALFRIHDLTDAHGWLVYLWLTGEKRSICPSYSGSTAYFALSDSWMLTQPTNPQRQSEHFSVSLLGSLGTGFLCHHTDITHKLTGFVWIFQAWCGALQNLCTRVSQ